MWVTIGPFIPAIRWYTLHKWYLLSTTEETARTTVQYMRICFTTWIMLDVSSWLSVPCKATAVTYLARSYYCPLPSFGILNCSALYCTVCHSIQYSNTLRMGEPGMSRRCPGSRGETCSGGEASRLSRAPADPCPPPPSLRAP